MSGIAGWIDHTRDLRRERPTLLAMTAALAQRGPDAEQLWSTRSAGLGVRHSRPSGGQGYVQQPWVFEEAGATVLASFFTGTLYDREELAATLGVRWRASDAELVGRAFLRWGEKFAEQLDGPFAAALWSERDQELVLARDRLGNQPLYYYPLGSGVLFGSERKAILAHPAVDPEIDADGLRELFSYAGTAGHGILRGFKQVRPGHVLRIRREGETAYKYWELTAEEHTDDQATTIATVRELLGDSVRRTLGTGDVPGIMLSGGIDSSAVTALAHQALAERGGGTVRTFTVSFGGAEDFKEDEIWGSPDAPFVRSVVDHLGTDHTDLVLETGDIIDPAVRAAVLRAKDVPSPLGNMNTSLYLLCQAVREHVGSVLLGEIADAVFGGFAWVHNKQLVEAPMLPWVAMGQFGGGKHGLGGDLLAPDLLGKLDLNGYAGDAYTSSMAQVPRLDGETGQTLRMREITYFHLTRWLETLLSHDESLGSAVGLETRMPFCDHRLVNYAYNVPWSMKSFDGREKSLLRAAVADLLPDDVVNRAKSPYPVTQDPAYGRALCDGMAALLADPGAPAAALADTAGVRALIDDPSVLDSGMRAWVARANVEMLLGLNDWLQRYGVRVVL
ncbi:asparagine synthase (glutamine-hydrolyzing) [Streptomyces sp. NPDC050738]|uniref:asparagine synthase (glutamine-hydrolyzing) n=1 Tax=Streptomyces sp. NPDC050738 TaxID=3154744 RepID=UPI00341B1253